MNLLQNLLHHRYIGSLLMFILDYKTFVSVVLFACCTRQLEYFTMLWSPYLHIIKTCRHNTKVMHIFGVVHVFKPGQYSLLPSYKVSISRMELACISGVDGWSWLGGVTALPCFKRQ